MLARNGVESLDPFTSRDVQLFLKCSPIRRLCINVVENWKKIACMHVLNAVLIHMREQQQE